MTPFIRNLTPNTKRFCPPHAHRYAPRPSRLGLVAGFQADSLSLLMDSVHNLSDEMASTRWVRDLVGRRGFNIPVRNYRDCAATGTE
jgi:hypothetical protein